MSLVLFFAQHVSNASTFIFRSLRLCVGILLWFDVCWRYGVVRQAEAAFQPAEPHRPVHLMQIYCTKAYVWYKMPII